MAGTGTQGDLQKRKGPKDRRRTVRVACRLCIARKTKVSMSVNLFPSLTIPVRCQKTSVHQLHST